MDYNHSEHYSNGFIMENNTNNGVSPQYETTDFILNKLANDTDNQRLMDTHKAASLNLTAMDQHNKFSFSSTRTPLSDKRVISLQNFPSFPFLPNGPQSTSTPQDVLSQNKETQKLTVPPLNTTRILPTRHKTNKMILSISNEGSVIVEMIKFSTKLNEDRIMEVLKISGKYSYTRSGGFS